MIFGVIGQNESWIEVEGATRKLSCTSNKQSPKKKTKDAFTQSTMRIDVR
jgi:hypothetical protein